MAAVVLETMRKRAEFLAVRGGSRWSAPAFVLETKERRSTPDDLIADQLYGPVAVPLSTGEHRTVSHAHLAKELGAAARTRTQLAAAKVPMVVSHPVAAVRGALGGEHSMRSPKSSHRLNTPRNRESASKWAKAEAEGSTTSPHGSRRASAPTCSKEGRSTESRSTLVAKESRSTMASNPRQSTEARSSLVSNNI